MFKKNIKILSIIIIILLFLGCDTGSTTTTSRDDGIDEDDNPVQSTEKEFTSYSFSDPDVQGIISGTNISITVPFGTNVTSLVAIFEFTGEKITVDGTDQVSNLTSNDFSDTVKYLLEAEDGSTVEYDVDVTIESEEIEEITSPIYQYQAISTASSLSDFTTDLNTYGAAGYLWISSYTFSDGTFDLYVKDSTRYDVYSYEVVSAQSASTTFIEEADTKGSDGYLWKGLYYIDGVSYSIYLKNCNEQRSITNYFDSTSADFTTELNDYGSTGLFFKMSCYFGTALGNLYLQESSQDEFSYTVETTNDYTVEEFETLLNTKGTSGTLWKDFYYINSTESNLFVTDEINDRIYSYDLISYVSNQSSTDFIDLLNQNGSNHMLWKGNYYLDASINSIYIIMPDNLQDLMIFYSIINSL